MISNEGIEKEDTFLYTFHPSSCEVRVFYAKASSNHVRQEGVFRASDENCSLPRQLAQGQNIVLLEKYAVIIATNNQENISTLMAFDLGEGLSKHIHSSYSFKENIQSISLHRLNRNLNVAIVLFKDRMAFWSLNQLKIKASARKNTNMGKHSVTVNFFSNQETFLKTWQFNLLVLRLVQHPLMINSVENLKFQGWDEESNIHTIGNFFSGDNLSYSCNCLKTLYCCKVYNKIEFIKEKEMNWNLNAVNSSYLLIAEKNSDSMKLWQFDHTPNLQHMDEIIPSSTILNSEIDTDITRSIYIGNEGFTATASGDKVFTFLAKGYISTVSTYDIEKSSIFKREVKSCEKEYRISGLKYHQLNKKLYLILLLKENPMISYVAIQNEKPVLFPYIIEYIFFEKSCTVVFHNRAEFSIAYGWDLEEFNKASANPSTQFVKVMQHDNYYLLFVDQGCEKGGSCIEYWKSLSNCTSLKRLKTYYLMETETFNFDGTIISTIFLDYLFFISEKPNRGYLLNILNLSASQNDFLYASIYLPRFNREDIPSSIIFGLRLAGQNLIVLLGKTYYQYYKFELNPYVIVSNPSANTQHIDITAISSFNASETIKIPYFVKEVIKTPHKTTTTDNVDSSENYIFLPVNNYLNGFNLIYNYTMEKQSREDQTEIVQNILKKPEEFSQTSILAIYKCDNNTICAYRKPGSQSAPIVKYIIEEGVIRQEQIAKMTTLESIYDITNIVPIQFKDMDAFIIFGKNEKKTLYKYVIALTAGKMYKLAVIETDVKAEYAAIDNQFNYLLLHNRKNKELLAISITDQKTNLQLKQNCSVSTFPTKVLYCPQLSQLILASELCGIQIFSPIGINYVFNQSITIQHIINSHYEVRGVFGCDRQLYVVLKKQGILKFFYEEKKWKFEELIPNYENAILTEYAAFDYSVIAIFSYNSTNRFIRIFDLSRPSNAMPVFDIPINGSTFCKKLILHSTGQNGLYHLFYTCNEILFNTMFTLTPSLHAFNMTENKYNITLQGFDFSGHNSIVNISLENNLGLTIGLRGPFIGYCLLSILALVLLYCYGRESRNRPGYKGLIKELEEYAKQKQTSTVQKKSSIEIMEEEKLIIQ